MNPGNAFTGTVGFHGGGGVPHHTTSLDECQDICCRSPDCHAVDWEPSNYGRECRVLTDKGFFEVKHTNPALITHYVRERTSKGSSTLSGCVSVCASIFSRSSVVKVVL